MHAATWTLSPRNDDSTSSQNLSSQNSLSCNGKDASNPACEKPASSNGLQIGLGVAIPVFLILCVVAFFMFKNYRKEKREMSERDPDFDETGEVTALPDMPGFSSDPFKSGSSVNMVGAHGGYPLMSMQNKSVHDFGMITSPAHAFILPDQSQLGLKASLHEFARSSMDLRSHLQRRKSELLVLTGMASMEKLNGMDTMSPAISRATPLSTYENSPDSDGSRESGATTKSSLSDPEFGVRYENELKLSINSTLPSAARSLKLSDYVKSDRIESDKIKSDKIKSHKIKSESEHIESYHIKSDRKNSHLDSDDENSDIIPENHSTDDEIHFHNASEYLESNVSPFVDSHHFPDPPNVLNPGITSGKIAQVGEAPARADIGPRLSQLDMLHNVSDEDQEGEIDIPTRSPKRQAKETSPDQEEQLARMKSVYKVYFDRSNSVVSQKDHRASHAPFQVDAMQPLPSIHPDHLTTNEEINYHDASHASHARNTMTSSIYVDDTADQIIFSNQRLNVSHNSQFNGQGHQYNGNAPQGNAGASELEVQGPQYNGFAPQYNGYVSQSQAYLPQQHAAFPTVAPFQELPRSNENLLPLKSLPSASEIINSNLETYTLLLPPTSKLQSSTMRQQQGYFDGYVLGLPNLPSQASFSTNSSPNLAQYDSEVPPTIREQNTYSTNGTTPSPSQLSRTSVLMLNPVTEITSLRKFKPAGSLPSGMLSPGLNYMNDELASEHDLIPGNRKSAVRRMMNTNF